MSDTAATPDDTGAGGTDDLTAACTPVDLHKDGILYMINRQVFHPRGFALGHDPGDDGSFALMGDGTEPWRYATPDEAGTDAVDENALFGSFEKALQRARDAALDPTYEP